MSYYHHGTLSRNNYIVIIVIISIIFIDHTITINWTRFQKIAYCYGNEGCAMDRYSYSMSTSNIKVPSRIRLQSSTTHSLPDVIKCAYQCYVKKCVSFNYYSYGTCEFFNSYPFLIYFSDSCVYYEAKKNVPASYDITTNRALNRKTCQSSLDIASNTYLGPWLLVDGGLSTNFNKAQCAQTDGTAESDNWWMIDLEHSIRLSFVRLLTKTSNKEITFQKLDGLEIGVTNITWFISKPIRSEYSICIINKMSLYPATFYTFNCTPSILPGRYVVIQQGIMSPSTTGDFAICEFEAYGFP